jgi:hypothetical protein
MYFKQFARVLAPEIKSQVRSYGHLIEETVDGAILVDKQVTDMSNLEEARQYIINKKYNEQLEQEAKTDLYEEISKDKIVNIINEHHIIKVTDTLIETYIEFASSKIFTLDPVITDIRKLNKLDKLVEGKIDYKLNDNSIIAINEDTQQKLNSLFKEHQDVIEYMRDSKENFLSVLNTLGE